MLVRSQIKTVYFLPLVFTVFSPIFFLTKRNKCGLLDLQERILQVQENKGRQAAVAEYLTLVRSYCGWGFEFLDALNFTGLRDLAYMLDPSRQFSAFILHEFFCILPTNFSLLYMYLVACLSSYHEKAIKAL